MELNNEHVQTLQFEAGETLFMENETSFHFFIVKSGNVEVYKTLSTGRKVPLALIGEGTAVGEFSMIDQLPRSATARAVSPVTAVKISAEGYRQLLSELPDWATSMLHTLVERLRYTNEVIRKAGIIDSRTQESIAYASFDPDAGTIIEENPYLCEDSADDEDLGGR